MRTLLRAVLPLFVLACLLPGSASAQDPTAGYQATLPETATGTTPPPPSSGTKAEETSGSSAPDEAAPAEPAAAPSTNTLPFTGFQIAAMIAAGLALLGLGMALRRVSGPALPGT